jgi:hypothetical protein
MVFTRYDGHNRWLSGPIRSGNAIEIRGRGREAQVGQRLRTQRVWRLPDAGPPPRSPPDAGPAPVPRGPARPGGRRPSHLS